MRSSCFESVVSVAKRTLLDMRVARIQLYDERMMSSPATSRAIETLKCNIDRLRDLKEIHHDVGYDLLVPDEQLYLALDLLVTDLSLLHCELEAEVRNRSESMAAPSLCLGEIRRCDGSADDCQRYLSAVSTGLNLDLSGSEIRCLSTISDIENQQVGGKVSCEACSTR